MSIAAYLSNLLNSSGLVPVNKLNISGTPTGAKFLRDDASWQLVNTLTSATAVASTSGTSIDFTSIPSWVKRITLMFQGVSTNGTTDICVQLGTGATPTYTTSGYTGVSSVAGGSGTAMATSGLITVSSVVAAQNYSGIAVISNINGNAWTFQGTMSPSATAQNGPRYGSGYVSLAAVLTAVRITAGGTDTFDAGSINIQYE